MKIVLLDAYTANPGDVSWAPFEALGECSIHERTPIAETVARAKGAKAIITNKAVLSREIIEELPDLEYIGVLATGYNVVDLQAATERGITVTNVPGYSTPAVAQLVFSLLLDLAGHAAHHGKQVRDGRWVSCPDFSFWDHPIIELQGRTMGLIGFGDIGSAVARIATAFGMEVIAARRTWALPPPEGVTPVSIDEVFRQSDAISLHCPLNDDTREIVNERTLGLMRPTAFLVNTARGPLVNEAALAAALNLGQIAGAGLDVLSAEPPKPSNPLLCARNCLVTPHIGWASREARVRLIQMAADNLGSFLEGNPTNVVNRISP